MVFSLLGIPYKVIEKHENVFKVLEDVLRSYRIVLVDEDLSRELYRVKERVYKDLREPPLIVILPSLSGSESTRATYLKEIVSKAIGARLKW